DLRSAGAGLQRAAVPCLLAELPGDVRQRRAPAAGAARDSRSGRAAGGGAAMIRPLDALRVLLGAVMVVTAIRYFMPFLLPFVPVASWDDPMALRLMTAFDKSGLLAVLTVALNALLMLAYLPAYRGVLDGGQLADGEGAEAGQNYESLFVNPLSGAPAAAYGGAALVLAAALAFYWRVVPGLNGPTGLVTLAVPTVLLAIGALRALTRKA